jgi:bifunctional non-homologous end joining protein LigD
VGDDDNVDFYALGQRMLSRRVARTVTFCAFDVLWLDGIDCTQLPYRDRRRVLDMLELYGPAWCTVPRFPFDEAEDLLDACARLKQEGIVLKRVDAPYTPGVRTDVWRKVKTTGWRTTHAPRRLPKELRERIYG